MTLVWRCGLVLLALTCALASAGSAEEGAAHSDAADPEDDWIDPARLYRWLLPEKDSRELPRGHVSDLPDWNPLVGPARELKGALANLGLHIDLDLAFFNQYASDVEEGEQNLATFAWRLNGDARLAQSRLLGATYIQWNLLGSPGINYDTHSETLSENVGSISRLNSEVYPDPAALNEVFWKQISPGGGLVLLLGKIDMSYHFDTNRAANNGYTQFVGSAFQNDPSIPFPTYGGLGGLLRISWSENLYLMLGAGDSSAEEPFAVWKTVDDGSWFELLELGLTREIPRLGQGVYRVTPWHNRFGGESGYGFSLNVDQELGAPWALGFLRFGLGSENVTEVERFLSGGITIGRPFGRAGEMAGLAVAWSDPSPDLGSRDEVLLELFYRFQLSPSLFLSPDLQLILEPAFVAIAGVRLQLAF